MKRQIYSACDAQPNIVLMHGLSCNPGSTGGPHRGNTPPPTSKVVCLLTHKHAVMPKLSPTEGGPLPKPLNNCFILEQGRGPIKRDLVETCSRKLLPGLDLPGKTELAGTSSMWHVGNYSIVWQQSTERSLMPPMPPCGQLWNWAKEEWGILGGRPQVDTGSQGLYSSGAEKQRPC